MANFIDSSINELVEYTALLHLVKPETKGSYLVGIEQPNPGDLSVIFHMMDSSDNSLRIVALSIDHLVEITESLVVS